MVCMPAISRTHAAAGSRPSRRPHFTPAEHRAATALACPPILVTADGASYNA
jgi:hypothetical protein